MPGWAHQVTFWITQVVMLIGLGGLIIPVFPGLVVIWLAALGYGLVIGFPTLGIVLFVVITLLMVAGSIVDNILMGAGARQGGASWGTIALALVAGLLGTLIFSPVGGLLAVILAVVGLEYVRQKDWKAALRSLGGLAAGWGATFLVRFLIGLLMILLWWIWVWKG